MAVTLNKANLVLKDANGNIGKIEQLSNRDLAKIKTAMSDVALVVNQSNHKPIVATTTNVGVVKPDNNTIKIDSNGVLTATAKMPGVATTTNVGVVKPDGSTITVDSNGTLTAIRADSATNATNLGGYPATKYIRSVNSITPDASGNVQLGNLVKSVNGVTADAKGNIDVNKLKIINLGNFTENQEVTTLDTKEGNCVLAGANGKSHNYDMEGTDWAFIQVHSSTPYQKFQLGTADAKELMYRVSDDDDTSWKDWLQVSLIAEQGSNYIRYHNGIQICWDSIVTTQSSETWGTLYASKEYSYKNYPKAFISRPSFCVTNSLNYSVIISTLNGNNAKTPNITVCRPIAFSNISVSLDYIAIGRWK